MAEAKKPATFVMTERDLAMLASLHDARYLTAEQLEWLHFPTWLIRWQQWQQVQAQGSTTRYKPSAQLYSRLRRMEAEKYVRTIHRPVMLATNTYKRDADLYMLTERGAAVFTEYTGIELDASYSRELRPRSFNTLTHAAEIGKVYAALRSKAAMQPGRVLEDWRGDHITAKEYDRIDAQVPASDGSMRIEALPVQPDGVSVLRNPTAEALCFVEVERDRPPETWRRKIYAFEAYRGSKELFARYNQHSFFVLAFSLTDAQRQTLMEHTGQALAQLYRSNPERLTASLTGYVFSTLGDAHPARIGDGWRRITKITPQRQALPDGGSYAQVSIETAPHTLLR